MKALPSMRLSVIIPTYNRAHYLKQAIDSALKQDYDNFEIVVVDNASTDGTSELMQEYTSHPKVRYFRNAINIGMVPSWRRAVFELVCGEWFIILSDDDYIIKQSYFRNVVDLIAMEPELMLVYADGYLLNEETGEKTLLDLPFSGVVSGKTIFCSRGQVKPQDFTLCNIFFRRDLARRLNAFANPDNLSCDTELFLLSCLHGNVGVIKGPATVYRIHPNNLIKSVSEYPRLCYGNLDSLLSPYLAAQKMGLGDCAETLRTSTRLDRQIALALLSITCLDLPFLKQAKAALTERAPDLAHAIFQRPIYCMAEWLGRVFPFLYPAYIKFKKVRIRVFEVNRHPKPVTRQNTMPKDEWH